jgi:DnaJ-class molecular chaperone
MSHYEILGLLKNCSIDDIKKSYKKLCLKYHPDVSEEDPERFLEIKESYDYLLKNHKPTQEKSFDKMFSDMFKTMNKQRNTQQVVIVRASIEEAASRFTRDLSIFIEVPCQKCTQISRSICKVCDALGYKKELKKDTFTFEDITQQDQNFIYKSYHKDVDLCIKVHLVPPGDFKIKGKTLESCENIDIFKAIVGGDFTVRTLNGYEKITLPEGNISDFNYILNGKGLFGGPQLIKLKVFLAKNLTNKQKNKLIDLIHEENFKENEQD